jgi:hypothetical protein
MYIQLLLMMMILESNFNLYENISITICNHLFHINCLNNWLNSTIVQSV